ncbi:CHRD domain-containing protein [Acidimicrobiia bacterium EGI L10123]|uniref:CHRD domain-containing protein n=1 Tax=Salinilacustrithrix flava TaxID=2957203 RepID=UPI003D7C14D0|nr:CHRD domain-containing protein [Acidimicrobiia bacterium EGI L10123]
MRRSLALLVPLVVLVACGGDDDDAADRATTTVVDDASITDTTAPPEAEADEPAEGAPSETAPDTTVPMDAPAGDAPDGADGGDGLGDAVLASDLDGRGPVPGPGDTAATGRFEAELVDGTLCVDLVASGLDAAVTEAHLHGGPEGEEGPVLVDLGPPSTSDGGGTTWTDVCTGVDDDVIDDLAAAPELAYVDVHTASFPDGAIRGQLGVISIFDRTLD